MHTFRLIVVFAFVAAACGPATGPGGGPAEGPGGQRGQPGGPRGRATLPLAPREAKKLPTGRSIQPVGNVVDVGSMPLNMVVSPEKTELLVSLGGWREQGVQIIDRGSGSVEHTWRLPSTFYGMNFSADYRSLFVSGGDGDVIYRFGWSRGPGDLDDSIILAPKARGEHGKRYPAGLAPSADGKTLYVAENLADSLAVVDLPTKRVVARFATGRYPYAVVVGLDGSVYVSAWGDSTVSVFRPKPALGSGALQDLGRIRVSRHPSALALNGDGSRLFVASGSTDRIDVIDTDKRQVLTTLLDPPPGGTGEGSTPNALTLSVDGTRLFVAEADNNAVAVFDLSSKTANILAAHGDDKLVARIPTGWYPTAVFNDGDNVLVLNGKGSGTAPNPRNVFPLTKFNERIKVPAGYTLGQLNGSLQSVVAARATAAQLSRYTEQVARLNGWNTPDSARGRAAYPPIEHVVYIIKENRTYDQVFGDLGVGDGNASLVFFPDSVSPNHRALAQRFGVFDRFFVNAEVSADGHNWSTAAYATDYVQKTVPSQYSERGRTFDYTGVNRGDGTAHIPDDDVASPANGYLWDAAQKAGITMRDYGEFVAREGDKEDKETTPGKYRGTKAALRSVTNEDYPGFNLNIRDQVRADVWIAELQRYVRDGRMPALEIVSLPNDHTSGVDEGKPTPRAYFADNDLALGRMIEALSKTPFWRSTVVFVVEDDAQAGPDHVDSHRSPFLAISPYIKAGLSHRWTNTTDVVATIVELLKLQHLSQFDFYGSPLRDIWTTTPDFSPYTALTPRQSLDERNPRRVGAARGPKLDFSREDANDDDTFNRVLWNALKPGVPYPGATRASSLEWRRR